MSQARPKVLVILPVSEKALRDKMRGILRYADRNGPWEVQFVNEHRLASNFRTLAHWRPNGVILSLNEMPPASVLSLGKPMVVIDDPIPLLSCYATVCNDPEAITRAVSERFLKRGFRHFACVGVANPLPWSTDRLDCFAAAVAQAGFGCEVYQTPPGTGADWGLEEPALIRWLKALPKPCGVMAVADQRAKQVLDACRAAGIKVPEQLAVIGVDNEEDICENTVPTLSSVLPDFEGGGYLAAEMLGRLMRGEPCTRRATYGVKGIVERMSSQDLRGSGRLVALAGEEIRLHAAEGLRAETLARTLNVSPRVLELRFAEVLGRTAREEILRAKLRRACDLLRESRTPLGDIAGLAGFGNDAHLKALFKKRLGLTMGDYRRREASSLPRTAQVEAGQTAQVSAKLWPLDRKVLAYVHQAGEASSAEIVAGLGYRQLSGSLKAAFRRLLKARLLAYTRPGAPRSRLQKYKAACR